MSASYRDAAAGWEIYRDSHFSLTLDEVNEALRARGYHPVSPRTYDHYERLRRRGIATYLPINRFDVDTARQRARQAAS